MAFALFLVTVGLAGWRTGRLPRWAGWSALAIGDRDRRQPAPWPPPNLIDVFGLLGLLWVVAVAVAPAPEPGCPPIGPVE